MSALDVLLMSSYHCTSMCFFRFDMRKVLSFGMCSSAICVSNHDNRADRFWLSISWLLMTWWQKGRRHQQEWDWPSCEGECFLPLTGTNRHITNRPNSQIPHCPCPFFPQCTIQNKNVYISVLNGALWDIGQVHCGNWNRSIVCDMDNFFFVVENSFQYWTIC